MYNQETGSQVELTEDPQGQGLPPRETIAAKEIGADASHPKPFHSVASEILFVGVICVAQLATQISLGQTLNLVHVIGDHFKTTNSGTLSWFIAGYSLTVGSFILLFGRFGDYYGYKRLFVIGLCWFSLWSMIAGVSSYSNYVFFLFSRVLQGNLSTPFECFSLSQHHTRHWSRHVSSQCGCSSRRYLPSRAAKESYICCVWRCCPRRRRNRSCIRRHLLQELAVGLL